MSDDLRVQELLDELDGSRATPEEMCRSCPELLNIVRQCWRQMCLVRQDHGVCGRRPPGTEVGGPAQPPASLLRGRWSQERAVEDQVVAGPVARFDGQCLLGPTDMDVRPLSHGF